MAEFGLIGKKLTHSFSQNYFTDKFRKLKLDFEYANFELDEIQEVEKILKQKGLRGLNVTIPYKESIIPFLDDLSEDANSVKAVNTIQFKGGRLIGHNTDVFGFKQMIKPFFESQHERAMIIGTGGASKAVAYVLENLGVNLIYISRNPKGPDQFDYEEINDKMIAFNPLIVNTSPVGMYPNIEEEVNIPYQFITRQHLVVDLIYNPDKTRFLQLAQDQGATILNGLTMLHQQAEKAWQIWNE